jgi:molybdopterin-guanine dinucleotide biosynthesis protein A
MSTTFAVILAGGGGTRLGDVRKADLRIGGVRLLDRVAGILNGQVDEVLISSGSFGDLDLTGTKSINDQSDERMGPLAGIRAAVVYLADKAASEAVLISVAVDTPFLPTDYVGRLNESLSDNNAAYAAWGEDFYPTNAAWRLGPLRSALAESAENVGPKAILGRMSARRVDWSSASAADPFTNLNTLADLLALQRRALGR